MSATGSEAKAGGDAVILLSGGLDSATCLAMASDEGYRCHALTLDYHQRHRSELDAAERVARELGVAQHKRFSVDLTAFGGSALTETAIAVPERSDGEIPVTYVPARNTVFLSLALAWAEALAADAIFIGVNAVDYSGYPDCRPEYIEAFREVARLGTKRGVEGAVPSIRTPLSGLSKAEIIAAGARLGVDYSVTVSCYRADAAGRACGHCDSCRLRLKGFADAGLSDPAVYSQTRE